MATTSIAKIEKDDTKTFLTLGDGDFTYSLDLARFLEKDANKKDVGCGDFDDSAKTFDERYEEVTSSSSMSILSASGSTSVCKMSAGMPDSSMMFAT